MNVLLLHGLGRTPWSMQPLARALRRAGHRPHSFGYWAWAQSYASIVERLCRQLEALAVEPYAAVAHSLGGLLLREALSRLSVRRPAVVVLLGTPNRPPRAARWASRFAPFRWLTRDCGRKLLDADWFNALPMPDYPYRLLAGTGGWCGRRSPFGDEANDGLVAVSETRIRDGDEVQEIAGVHTFLMRHREVVTTVCEAVEQVDSPFRELPPST